MNQAQINLPFAVHLLFVAIILFLIERPLTIYFPFPSGQVEAVIRHQRVNVLSQFVIKEARVCRGPSRKDVVSWLVTRQT